MSCRCNDALDVYCTQCEIIKDLLDCVDPMLDNETEDVTQQPAFQELVHEHEMKELNAGPGTEV